MASHVASATIRRHQQETKAHKAQSKLLHQNNQSSDENCVTCENGAVYASTPVSSDLEKISEIPGAEEEAFEICLSDENRRFTPASSSTPLKDKYPMATNSCHEARSHTHSSSTCSTDTESTSSPIGEAPSSTASSVTLSTNGQQFIAPILGYEILEQRARFTVFKIQVQRIETQESWFVFRRFTDFARLNRKLRGLFPTVRFPLPPKRWFKDNFDSAFLDDRVQGLQAFVNYLLSRREICESHHVREFFCFDDPPGPDDCIEESRLRCETLEDMVATLRLELTGKQAEVDAVRAELALTKAQREILLKSLRLECEMVKDQSLVLFAKNPTMQRLHHTNVTLFQTMERNVNIQRSTNNIDGVSSRLKSSTVNRPPLPKLQTGKGSSLDNSQMDSCEDFYITAIQYNGEDDSSRIGRKTLIEETSGESTSGQSPELSEQNSTVSSDSTDLGDFDHRDSIRLHKCSYLNKRPTDLPATTDDNGNQTFSKPVGLRLHDTAR